MHKNVSDQLKSIIEHLFESLTDNPIELVNYKLDRVKRHNYLYTMLGRAPTKEELVFFDHSVEQEIGGIREETLILQRYFDTALIERLSRPKISDDTFCKLFELFMQSRDVLTYLSDRESHHRDSSDEEAVG